MAAGDREVREVQAFRRGIAEGKRAWAGLALPWDADLRGLSLAGCDLSGASLRGALLDGVVLSECKLVEADLRRASLRGAILVRADLRGANLRGADLRGADLTKADLCEADLVASDAREAIFEGAAVSFACKAYAGVALSGATVRQLYSLIMLSRPDDPEIVRALESLRPVLGVPIDARIELDEDEVRAEEAARQRAAEGHRG